MCGRINLGKSLSVMKKANSIFNFCITLLVLLSVGCKPGNKKPVVILNWTYCIIMYDEPSVDVGNIKMNTAINLELGIKLFNSSKQNIVLEYDKGCEASLISPQKTIKVYPDYFPSIIPMEDSVYYIVRFLYEKDFDYYSQSGKEKMKNSIEEFISSSNLIFILMYNKDGLVKSDTLRVIKTKDLLVDYKVNLVGL